MRKIGISCPVDCWECGKRKFVGDHQRVHLSGRIEALRQPGVEVFGVSYNKEPRGYIREKSRKV